MTDSAVLAIDHRRGELLIELDLPDSITTRDYVEVPTGSLEEWRSTDASVDELLPATFKTALANLDTQQITLKLGSDVLDLPWEEVSLGGTALGQKYVALRKPVVASNQTTPPASSEQATGNALVIIAPTDEYHELAQTLYELLSKELNMSATLLLGPEATVAAITNANARAVHVLSPTGTHANVCAEALLGGAEIALEEEPDAAGGTLARWRAIYSELSAGRSFGDVFLDSENRVDFRLYGDGDACLQASTSDSHLSLPSSGERRPLTVLFCDIVGSTSLAQNLAEEQYSELLRMYHHVCGDAISATGGHIQQYLGDGILAYFGYPKSYEDNAARAVNAGLALISSLRQLNNDIRTQLDLPIGSELLHIRVGIHSGLAVVEDIGREQTERFALGMVPTIAARLQDAAATDSVLISQSTERIVHGLFQCSAQEGISLKGVSGEMQTFIVHAASEAESRFDVQIDSGLTPFTGRASELQILEEAAARSALGQGQLVVVSGEPGIGKTRLLLEFTGRLPDTTRTLTVRGSVSHQQTPMYPIIEGIRLLLKIDSSKPLTHSIRKIERFAKTFGLDHQRVVPSFAHLFDLELTGNYQPSKLPPDQLRIQTTRILTDCIIRLAERTPMCLIVEDWHWIDASSAEVLATIAGVIDDSYLCVVVTSRPGVNLSSLLRSEATKQLVLGPLSGDEASAMVLDLAGEHGLSPNTLSRLVEFTNGVPLFVEESTVMALADSQHGSPSEVKIPATLQDLLTTRLDQLGNHKAFAQVASVLGIEFSRSLLASVAAVDTGALNREINALIEAVILLTTHEIGRLTFKHALMRDAAYQSLLAPNRRSIHLQAAQALQILSVSESVHPELIAHHYTEAGKTREAVKFWHKAGRSAVARGAAEEAISHFRRGINLLSELPRDTETIQTELRMQTGLAGRIIATQGYAAKPVEGIYQRVIALAHELDDEPTILRATLGLEGFYHVQARFRTAHRLANQCMAVAKELGDPARILTVHWTSGEIFFHQGNYTQTRIHLGACIEGFNREYHRATALQNPAVMSLCYYSWMEYAQGEFDNALQTVKRAVDLAEEIEHPFSQGVAYAFLSSINLFHGRMTEAHAVAEQAVALCEEHGFTMWQAYATVILGRSAAELNHSYSDSIATIEAGIDNWTNVGAVVTLAFCKAMLAQVHLNNQNPELALNIIEEALHLVEEKGEGYYHPEILRIRGEILATLPNSTADRVNADFNHALDIARTQQARGLELRILTSISNYNQGQAGTEQLAILLDELQGANNIDLQHARAALKSTGG